MTTTELRFAFTACWAQLWCFKKTVIISMLMIASRKPRCVLAYLCACLRRVYSHHVVPEKLLKELHLGNTEVEVQAAGHIYLQRVATHHHLLHRDEGESTAGIWRRGGWRRSKTSGLFATLSPSLYEHSLLLSAILAHLFPSLHPLQGPTHSPKATSNRISFTNTPGLNHTQAPKQEPRVTTDNVNYRYIYIGECYSYGKVNKRGPYIKRNIYSTGQKCILY